MKEDTLCEQINLHVIFHIELVFFLIEDTYLLCLNNSTNDFDELLLANGTTSKTRLDNQLFSKSD
jgi:hypothetical protein